MEVGEQFTATDVIVKVAGATVSDSSFDDVCCGLLLSLTVTEMLKDPETVGVPKSAPVVVFIAIPLGWPEPDQA